MIKTQNDGVASSAVATKQPSVTNRKTTGTATKADSNDTLKKVQGFVNDWLAYRKTLMENWERDIKLYGNKRYKRGYEGVADTFVPMPRSTVDTITAALVTGDYNTDFIPQDIYKYLSDNLMQGFNPEAGETEEQYLARAIKEAISGGSITDESLEILNALYDYHWDCGDWDKIITKLIKSGLKIGNGALWIVWEKNKPKLIYVAFPDFVFDPESTDDDSGRFKGRRYLASLADLKNETIIDPLTGKQKKRYSLKGVTKNTLYKKDDKTDKQLKEELLFGSTMKDSEDSDQVEVIELRAGERQYVLVNRKVLAEDVESPIITQAKLRGIPTDELILNPCVTWANNEDDSLYIGESEIALIWQECERLNDSTNQKSDAVTRALLQLYRADPALKSQKNSFGVPGAVIWGTEGQFNVMTQAQVPSAAFAEENSIKNNIRETTATDQIVKGVGSSSDVTATEANLQVAQSGQRIQMKVKSLENGPLKRLARIVLQYYRLFLVDPFIFAEPANNGFRPRFYDPKKYNYVYEPKVVLTIEAQNQKKVEQRESIETYKMLIADPTNNLQAVKEEMLPKAAGLDKDEVAKITQGGDSQMAQVQVPTQQPMMQGIMQ